MKTTIERRNPDGSKQFFNFSSRAEAAKVAKYNQRLSQRHGLGITFKVI